MKVHTLVVGLLQTNCYVAEDEGSGKAVAIDPGGNGQEILDFIDSRGLDLRYIVITHGHIDHFLETGFIQAKKPVPVLISKADSVFLEDPGWMRAFPGNETMIRPKEVGFVKEGDVITFGNTGLQVLGTPGHSPGSYACTRPGSGDPARVPGVPFRRPHLQRVLGRTAWAATPTPDSIRKGLILPDDTTYIRHVNLPPWEGTPETPCL